MKGNRFSQLFCCLAVLYATLLHLPQAFSDTASKADLTGQILSKEGTGISGVTVFIESANPKAGVSPICPSCYPDCIKKAKTDAQGNFEIKSLDPKLIFRVLVAGKGHKPKFIPKIDPANGPIRVELEPFDESNVPSENSLRGRVENPKGQPIVGAVVETSGICKTIGGSKYGSLPGIVDRLAVTDEQGEFLITSKEPVASMDIKVTANGFSQRRANDLPSGKAVHKLNVTEGAIVKGRILHNGKPLPSVSVGAGGTDKQWGKYVGNFEIGTDSDGRFQFVNLPPYSDYFIYGKMETMKSYGVIDIRKIKAGADGSTLDVGDIEVQSGNRLAGQLVLDDGKAIPAQTRILISRNEASDSMQLELDKDGRFDVGGIPTEAIYIWIKLPGYRLSAKNKSLDTLNPSGIVGKVNRDKTDLVFFMEKGKELESYSNPWADKSEWPVNNPLRGAEGADDHSNELEFSGRVIDADTREPISRFQIIPAIEFGMDQWNRQQAVSGSNGNFAIYLAKNLSSYGLKIEADGYFPLNHKLKRQSESNLEFALKKGSGPKGRVLLPNGESAAGVTVVMLCRGDDAFLDDKDEVHRYHNTKHERITDADGIFSFEPALDMVLVVAGSRDGFRIVNVDSLAANSNIVLEAYGTIKGILKRPTGPAKGEDLHVSLEIVPGSPWRLVNLANLSRNTVTDSEGKFELTRVPPGKLEIFSSIRKSQSLSTPELLQKVKLKPEETLEININASEKAKIPNLQ